MNTYTGHYWTMVKYGQIMLHTICPIVTFIVYQAWTMKSRSFVACVVFHPASSALQKQTERGSNHSQTIQEAKAMRVSSCPKMIGSSMMKGCYSLEAGGRL